MATPYLLSRSLDPILGLFTGVLAYYLHETHPRTAPPEGSRLIDLLRWRMNLGKKGYEAPRMTIEAMRHEVQQMNQDMFEPARLPKSWCVCLSL